MLSLLLVHCVLVFKLEEGYSVALLFQESKLTSIDGIARMMSKIVERGGDYKGFKVNDALEFQLLQFVDR